MAKFNGKTIRCPKKPRCKGDIAGCGSTNIGKPDEEGYFDCPSCGIFFKAEAAEYVNGRPVNGVFLEDQAKPLYKTTIVIWSTDNPTNKMELSELARDAESGNSYCSSMSSQKVEKPENDPDWDGTDFFDDGSEDEDEA